MKIEQGLSGLALAFALTAVQTHAQSSPDKPAEKPGVKAGDPNLNEYGDRVDPHPYQIFYLHNVSVTSDSNELLTALRLLLEPATKLYLDPSQNAIMMRGSQAQIALAQRIINDLDRPKKDYRLNYTLTESDNGKRIGVSHLSMVTSSGNRSTVKQGSKVPIITGSYDREKTDVQTQFVYLDIGVNLDATVTDINGGVYLKAKAEESSIAEEKSGVGTDPIVRQSVLDLVTNVTLGKPMVLGSLDIQGSTRHLDIEVVVDQIK